jgi:hypothetical protein
LVNSIVHQLDFLSYEINKSNRSLRRLTNHKSIKQFVAHLGMLNSASGKAITSAL